MKARRQIVDPITGAKVDPSSPVAVDTGNLIVGRDVVVDDDDRDPAGDRFGLTPEAQARLGAELAERHAQERAPRGRGPAFKTTMPSPAAGAREFEALNPQIFEAPAFDDVDIHDAARDFMHGIEVERGRGRSTTLDKTPAGRKILEARSGSAVARGVLRYLMSRAPQGRWRDVPWNHVLGFTEQIVDAMGPEGPSASSISYPIAAGLDPPDVVVARAREELGPAAAAKVVRKLNADELRSLADRLERAIDSQGEECLSGTSLRVAKDRLRTLKRWARNPDQVPDALCVGTIETEGSTCTYPGLLEDIQRLERACEQEYDPQWPLERAEKACERGDEEGRTGMLGKPCETRAVRVPRLIKGRLVR